VTERVVAVLVRPTGIDPELAAAMLEDVVDLVADTPQVAGALAVRPGAPPAAAELAWPGTPVVEVAGVDAAAALVAVAGLATAAVAVVVADAPDLPTLLLGKFFSALAGPPRRTVAVCPAAAGGLVAVAVSLPGPPGWLEDSRIGFDDVEALSRLREVAPRGELALCPGWHRIRSAADVASLDPALEGWDATRALLASG